MLSFIKLKGLG